MQSFASRRAVGPDKAARAEQRSAEVAGNHHGAVVHVFTADDLENGPAGGAGRFAVVAGASYLVVLAHSERIYIMGSVPELPADLVHKCLRVFFGSDRGGCGDELTPFDDGLRASWAAQG